MLFHLRWETRLGGGGKPVIPDALLSRKTALQDEVWKQTKFDLCSPKLDLERPL